MISATLTVFTLNILWIVCQAVPLMDLKDTLEGNVLQPDIVTSGCSSTGGCWEWLPVEKVEENDAIVPDNPVISRLHARRQAVDINPNTVLEPWSENVPALNKKGQSASPTTRQIGNRVSKKDVFVSRSWGAGGMPFSVLYMNPHGPRGNHASTTQQQDVGKTTESSATSMGHPNYRIALRNGASVQPRRQYSIIPQLFISYGWGPFGK